MDGIPTIETKRLRLRPFSIPADNLPLYHLMNGEDVMRYFPGSPTPSMEQVARLLTRKIEHWQQHGYGWWAVQLKIDKTLIGWCGLQYLPETDETEVGYLLGRDYWGRGLATEAARASLDWGFANLSLTTIIGITHPDNKASQRVLEKCGLAFVRNDRYFDMDCFVFTRHDNSA